MTVNAAFVITIRYADTYTDTCKYSVISLFDVKWYAVDCSYGPRLVMFVYLDVMYILLDDKTVMF